MERNEFTHKLYFELAEKGEHPFDIYGAIFSKVFYGVKEYSAPLMTINVSRLTGGKFKTLGEIFEKSNQHGILDTLPKEIITNFGFSISLFDDGFEVYDQEFKNQKFLSIMKPEYQKRYVAEMYKMFGEPYKKHYRDIIQEKRNKLDEEAEFIK